MAKRILNENGVFETYRGPVVKKKSVEMVKSEPTAAKPEVEAPAVSAEEKSEDLSSLSAKELKVIAKEKGIEFAANAGKDRMLELLGVSVEDAL